MAIALNDREAERLNDSIVDKNDSEKLNEIIRKAELLLGNIGVRVDSGDIVFEIVDEKEMARQYPQRTAVGLTCPIRIEGKKHKIWLLTNLPYIYLLSVVAHEMGHTWCRDKHIVYNEFVEEGLCELFAYHILTTQLSKLGNAWKETMLNNPDPIYGDGFRYMKKQLESRGNSWFKLLGFIKMMYKE